MEVRDITTADIDLIERRLDGELTDGELHEFEARISSDTAFRELYQTRQEIREVWVLAHHRESIRREVAGLIADEHKRTGFIARFIPESDLAHSRYAIAAGLLLLAGIGLSVLLFKGAARETVMALFRNRQEMKVHPPEEQSFKARFLDRYTQSEMTVNLSPASRDTIESGKNILFTWKKNEGQFTIFTILNATTRKPVFASKIAAADTSFLLFGNVLGTGEYAWFPGDTLQTGLFIIR